VADRFICFAVRELADAKHFELDRFWSVENIPDSGFLVAERLCRGWRRIEVFYHGGHREAQGETVREERMQIVEEALCVKDFAYCLSRGNTWMSEAVFGVNLKDLRPHRDECLTSLASGHTIYRDTE
jgi:hypothetical protein